MTTDTETREKLRTKAAALVALGNEVLSELSDVPAPPPVPPPEQDPADEKAGRRMNKGHRQVFADAMNSLKRVFDWSNYVEEDTEYEDEAPNTHTHTEGSGEETHTHVPPKRRRGKPAAAKDYDEDEDYERNSVEFDFVETDESFGFKVVATKDGPRWIAFSSNAFLDRDEEIFTTAALEEAVKASDDGEWPRGPLRVFHVDGADIGDADWQGIVGRMLVESGTFRDDEMGQKAVDYLTSHKDEKFQVSIGYRYKVGDEEDGVYDWVRILERSILPHGTAANPYTSFSLGGDEMIDERKSKMLHDWFGQDMAVKILGHAEERSKELEGSVRFKEADPTTVDGDEILTELKAVADDEDMPPAVRKRMQAMIDKRNGKKPDTEEKAADDEAKEPDVTAAIGHAFELFQATVDALTGQIDGLKELPATVAKLQTAVDGLSTDIKEVKERPRGAGAFRATEADDNLVGGDKAKEMIGEHADPPTNAARDHVTSLLGTLNGGRARE